METKKENTLKITLNDSEPKIFTSIIKKCVDENKKVGFGLNTFNEKEIKLIKEINESL